MLGFAPLSPTYVLLARRFARACERLGINRRELALDSTRFRPPTRGGQMTLF